RRGFPIRMSPEVSRSWTLSGGICRSSSVRAARSLNTGTRSPARRRSSSRVRSEWAIPVVANSPGLTAPPCYAGRLVRARADQRDRISVTASEGETHRPRQKSHERRLGAAGRDETGGKLRCAGLPLAESHAGREAQPLEIVDERVVGIEAPRRPLQRRFAMREARALRSFPSTWVLDDRLADGAQGLGARAPDTRAHEDLTGPQWR